MFVQKPLYAEVCFNGLDSKEWVCQVNYYTQNTFYFNRCRQIIFLKDSINSSFYQQNIKIAFSLSLLPAKDHCYHFFLFQEGQGLRRQSHRYKVIVTLICITLLLTMNIFLYIVRHLDLLPHILHQFSCIVAARFLSIFQLFHVRDIHLSFLCNVNTFIKYIVHTLSFLIQSCFINSNTAFYLYTLQTYNDDSCHPHHKNAHVISQIQCRIFIILSTWN